MWVKKSLLSAKDVYFSCNAMKCKALGMRRLFQKRDSVHRNAVALSPIALFSPSQPMMPSENVRSSCNHEAGGVECWTRAGDLLKLLDAGGSAFCNNSQHLNNSF